MKLKSRLKFLCVFVIILTLGTMIISCRNKDGFSYDENGNIIKDKYYFKETYGVTDDVVKERFSGDLVTRDYLEKTWGIVNEDLKNIDLDEVVYYADLFVNRMDEDRTKEQILDDLSWYQEQLDYEKFLKENDKSYLLEAELTEEPLPDIKIIKYLLYERYSKGFGKSETISILLDFQTNRQYCNYHQSLKSDYIIRDNYVEFTDEEKNIIIDEFNNLGILDWYGRNNSKDKWKIGIEFEDGTVITMSGNTDDEEKPKNYDEFIQFLQIIEKEDVLEWFDYYY